MVTFARRHDGEPLQLKLFCDEDRNGVPGADRYVQGLHEGEFDARRGNSILLYHRKRPTVGACRNRRCPALAKEPAGSWLWYEVELLAIEEDASTGTITDPRSFFCCSGGRLHWTGLTQQEDQACGFVEGRSEPCTSANSRNAVQTWSTVR